MEWMVNAIPRSLYLRERDPVFIVWEASAPQGRSGRMLKISPSPGFDCVNKEVKI
jgi:hypothetical protein